MEDNPWWTEMEVSQAEKLLIEGIREMNDAASNMLLWYVSANEKDLDRIREINPIYADGIQYRIDIANKYQRLIMELTKR